MCYIHSKGPTYSPTCSLTPSPISCRSAPEYRISGSESVPLQETKSFIEQPSHTDKLVNNQKVIRNSAKQSSDDSILLYNTSNNNNSAHLMIDPHSNPLSNTTRRDPHPLTITPDSPFINSDRTGTMRSRHMAQQWINQITPETKLLYADGMRRKFNSVHGPDFVIHHGQGTVVRHGPTGPATGLACCVQSYPAYRVQSCPAFLSSMSDYVLTSPQASHTSSVPAVASRFKKALFHHRLHSSPNTGRKLANYHNTQPGKPLNFLIRIQYYE